MCSKTDNNSLSKVPPQRNSSNNKTPPGHLVGARVGARGDVVCGYTAEVPGADVSQLALLGEHCGVGADV
jgi:hypothetical protein